VPPSASSNMPFRRDVAPVKAPFSCPKSSDSRRLSGRAAQLTAMNERAFRGEWPWMARATSSLPVPLSPVRSTVEWTGATRCRRSRTSRMARVRPMIPVASCIR